MNQDSFKMLLPSKTDISDLMPKLSPSPMARIAVSDRCGILTIKVKILRQNKGYTIKSCVGRNKFSKTGELLCSANFIFS